MSPLRGPKYPRLTRFHHFAGNEHACSSNDGIGPPAMRWGSVSGVTTSSQKSPARPAANKNAATTTPAAMTIAGRDAGRFTGQTRAPASAAPDGSSNPARLNHAAMPAMPARKRIPIAAISGPCKSSDQRSFMTPAASTHAQLYEMS
jgi:hypothetical protein